MPERTLKELDEALRAPKGTGFRRFKRIHTELTEGRDYRVLSEPQDQAEIAALREKGRVYHQSIRVILLPDTLYRRLLTGDS